LNKKKRKKSGIKEDRELFYENIWKQKGNLKNLLCFLQVFFKNNTKTRLDFTFQA